MNADHSQNELISARLKKATKDLTDLALLVGMSKTVITYNSDRMKSTLAKYVAKRLIEGQSATAAEALARADEGYLAEIEVVRSQHEEAEKVMAKYRAAEAQWDCCRSLLSLAKETIRQL